MMIIYYKKFLFIFIILYIKYIKSQEYNNYYKICSKLNIHKLYNNINIKKLNNVVLDSIQNNPFPMNNKTILDNVMQNNNPCPFRERILQKMSKNETINIVVVGGSETQGSGIIPIEKRFELRWSKLLDNLLNSGWYTGKFNVINISKGGWNIHIWGKRIDQISDLKPDMIIGDFTLNDAIEEDEKKIKDFYDIFVRLLETFTIRPAILLNFTFRLFKPGDKHDTTLPPYNYTYQIKDSEFFAYARFWRMQDVGKSIAIKYDIPFTSYRDIVFPDFFNPQSNLLHFWSDYLHPNQTAHKYMADNIFNTFSNLIKDGITTTKCQSRINSKLASFYNYCDRPSYIHPIYYNKMYRPVCYPDKILNAMDATIEYNSIFSFNMSPNFNESTSKWKFTSDSKSKFGWIYDNVVDTNDKVYNYLDKSLIQFNNNNITISEEDLEIINNNVLSFAININEVVQVTYLNSYPDYFGSFIVWFDNDFSKTSYINTRWGSQTSVPSSIYLLIKKIPVHHHLIEENELYLNVSPGSHILNILPVPRLDSPKRLKVKILGILSC